MTQSAQRPVRPASLSKANQVHIVLPKDVNASYHLFGGRLMEWIDIVAAVAAQRHCHTEVLTAAVDHLSFLAPANLGDTVELVGRVTYVGNTSMEVCVETWVEYFGKEHDAHLVNRAFLTMVALDENGRPTQVPMLELQTEQEKKDFEDGKMRRANRKRMNME